jgi:hypothetical protein
MTRWKRLWATLLAVPLAVGGGLLYANARAGGFVTVSAVFAADFLPLSQRCRLSLFPGLVTPSFLKFRTNPGHHPVSRPYLWGRSVPAPGELPRAVR